jgi:hypothetical protein
MLRNLSLCAFDTIDTQDGNSSLLSRARKPKKDSAIQEQWKPLALLLTVARWLLVASTIGSASLKAKDGPFAEALLVLVPDFRNGNAKQRITIRCLGA